MPVSATARGVTVSAKKLKLLVDMVRGKNVKEALDILRFTPTPAAAEVANVVRSAAANAENNLLLDPDRLTIISIAANQGPTLKRMRPRPRGRAGRILKRSSHITVVVEEA